MLETILEDMLTFILFVTMVTYKLHNIYLCLHILYPYMPLRRAEHLGTQLGKKKKKSVRCKLFGCITSHNLLICRLGTFFTKVILVKTYHAKLLIELGIYVKISSHMTQKCLYDWFCFMVLPVLHK